MTVNFVRLGISIYFVTLILTIDSILLLLCHRMESVCCQLQDMYKESISQSNSNKKAISSLDTRLTKLEEHTHRIVGLLERLQVLMPPESETLTNSDEHKETVRTVSLSDIEVTGTSSLHD